MANGLEQRFIEVIDLNKEKIFRICRIYASHPFDPQDLFQEVLFQVWKSLPKFKNHSEIGTWIYRIALNVCYSSRQQAKRRHIQTERLDSIHVVPSDLSHEEGVKMERYEALQACINELGESEKTLVILYLEDLPYKQIGNILGLTENHVAVKMKRIRKILLACIAPKLK